MKVLVACEYSGTIRDAFARKGHDAWSCDIIPTESGFTKYQDKHLQEDVIAHLEQNKGVYDLIIAHPPCTYMSNSGVRWLYPQDDSDKEVARVKRRWNNLKDARKFFMYFYNYPVEKLCIENPVPHKYAELPKYSQTVQPYEYGDPETKRTCLWLKGLPLLTPTNIVSERKARVHLMPPGPDRQKERSRFFPGIAQAMADQWTNILSDVKSS